MDIFPTQYSLLSAEALNHAIRDAYGFKNTTCTFLIHNVSDTYVFEDQNAKYIFRVYRNSHRSLTEIEGEIELLKALHEGGAKVSYPITDLQSNQVQFFNAAEGTRYGVLFSFAPGKVIPDPNHDQLRLIGREMGKIHNISSAIILANDRRPYTIETTLTEPLKTIIPAFKGLPEQYDYLVNTAKIAEEQIRKFDLTKFSMGYCHYDTFPKNFHITDDNKITFFDFDFAGYGLLANDLMVFYVHFFIEIYYHKLPRQKADEDFKVFLDAYRSARPLSDEEVKAIPILGFAFWIFYLGFQYRNFDEWSNYFFGNKYLTDRTALIKLWVDWYCKF